MKTRDRILDTALTLFNEQGEHKVTTNHLAAHLNMSPGNLYYHFKNKQDIIYDLFLQHEVQIEKALTLPEGLSVEGNVTLQDKFAVMLGVFESLWHSRFIHLNLSQLLSNSPMLKSRYRDFYQRCLTKLDRVYEGLNKSGIITISPEQRRGLVTNTWINVTAWFAFLQSCVLEEGQQISKNMVEGGMYQVLQLESPYINQAYQADIAALKDAYQVSLV
jgi:AcrR family transcriptional regulator